MPNGLATYNPFNLGHATKFLQMSPQEQYAYKHHLNNLSKGGVRQPDGSISTFLSTTVGLGDKTYVLPTVWDNKILSQEQAIKRAKADGLDKWPSYPTDMHAESRYGAMHRFMEKDMQYHRAQQLQDKPL